MESKKITITEYHVKDDIKIRLVINEDKNEKEYIIDNTKWVKEPSSLRYIRMAKERCQGHTGDADMKRCDCKQIAEELRIEGERKRAERYTQVEEKKEYSYASNDVELENPDFDILEEDEKNIDLKQWTGKVIYNVPTSVVRIGKVICNTVRTMIQICVPNTHTYMLKRTQNNIYFGGDLYNKCVYGDTTYNLLPRSTRIETCEECFKNGEFIELASARSVDEVQYIWNSYRYPIIGNRPYRHVHGMSFSGLGMVLD